jgi:hypothetical protein
MRNDEWDDIVSKMSSCLKSYTSRFDHISEITLTWVAPEPQNAPHAEANIITVEEQCALDASRSSGYSVKIVGIGSQESRLKSDGQMGFAVSGTSGNRGELVERPLD